MSGAPGVTVASLDSASSTNIPVGTGTMFIAGQAERGPVDKAVPIRNMEQYRRTFGERVAYGWLWDAVEFALAAGASVVYVSRIVGPTPVQATANATDGSAGVALVVKAKDPGAWGNELDAVITIPTSGVYKIEVKYLTETVEISPELTGKQAVVDWSNTSDWIRVTAGGGGNPTAQTVSPATGTDDRSNISITEKVAALGRFSKSLGPGQVSIPGDSTDAALAALASHAVNNNRVFIGDGSDTHTVGTHTATLAALRALLDAPGGVFGPWVIVDGVTPGTTRTIPPGILVSGKIADVDRRTGNPNEPAAGANGILEQARGLSQPEWSEADRQTLNEAGFNIIREIDGTFRIYGWRTPADPFTDAQKVNLNNVRLEMAIKAGARVVGERFNFRQIDAKGHMLGEFAGALSGEVLLPLYEVGAIFGDTAQEAFSVDTSEAVNPIEQLRDRDVVAQVTYKPAPFAERITINITKEDVQ